MEPPYSQLVPVVFAGFRQRPVYGLVPAVHLHVPSARQVPRRDEMTGSSLHVWSLPKVQGTRVDASGLAQAFWVHAASPPDVQAQVLHPSTAGKVSFRA